MRHARVFDKDWKPGLSVAQLDKQSKDGKGAVNMMDPDLLNVRSLLKWFPRNSAGAGRRGGGKKKDSGNQKHLR